MVRLLAVHAHPDDETLATGALLATAAAAGWDVGVLTATRGELGEVIPPELRHLHGTELGHHRAAELATALTALGVGWHHFLDEWADGPITDSGMTWLRPGVAGPGTGAGADALVHTERAGEYVAAAIADFNPDVVVTYDPTGGYHHPDHVRVHELVMAAEPAVVLWHNTPAAVVTAARAELAQLPVGDFALPAAELPGFTTDYGLPRQLVAVEPVLEQVLAARRAHATQIQAVEAVPGTHIAGRFALSDEVWQPIMDEGYAVALGSVPTECEVIWA